MQSGTDLNANELKQFEMKQAEPQPQQITRLFLMKLQEKPSKIYKLSSEYMLHNMHVAFLKFMLHKGFRNKQSIK